MRINSFYIFDKTKPYNGMKNLLTFSRKVFTLLLFLNIISINIQAQLSTGDIMFVGFQFDGISDVGDLACGDGFAFVALANIPANTTIYFTEEEYSGGVFGNEEGDVIWSHNQILPMGTVIEITTHRQTTDSYCDGTNPPISANIGTVEFSTTVGTGWSIGTSNEEIYAYLGDLRQPTIWLCAMLTDTNAGAVANTPPSELDGFILDFTADYLDADLGIFTSGTDCMSPQECLDNILNIDNWTVEDEFNISDCCDMNGVDYPEDLPVFSFAANPAVFAPTGLCENSNLQTLLSSGVPFGGVYSGAGITDDGNGMTYSLDPSIAGVGMHEIAYMVNGETVIDSFIIFESPNLSLVEDEASCVDQPTGSASAIVSNGLMPYNYIWSNSATTASIMNVSSGTYTVTITDANGCTDRSDITISEHLPITLTLNLPDSIFADPNNLPTGIDGMGTPTGGVYSDPNNLIIDDGNGMTFSIANANFGINTITYTYTDAQTGCTYETQSEVFISDIPVSIDNLNAPFIEIYPNPTDGFLTIKGLKDGEAELVDMHGRTFNLTLDNEKIDISNFSEGVYILHFYVENQHVFKRIIKL